MRDVNYRQVVHLSEARRAELLRRLDDLARARRISDAHPPDPSALFSPSIRCTIHHPGGGVGRFLISGRHLSPVGLWFIHTGYLHPGTRCVLAVPRGTHQEGGVLAEVVLCDHLDRGLHAVAVRFDEPIDPQLLISGAGAAAQDGRDPIELPRLDGSILLLDTNPLDCELLAFHLRSTGVRLFAARSPEDAIAELKRRTFNVLICDLNLEDCTGEAAMIAARKLDFRGPIIVLTAESDPKRLTKARRNGADVILEKPYNPAKLIRVLAAALDRSKRTSSGSNPALDPAQSAPIHSTLADQPGMAPLLERYIEQAARYLADLERAVHENDFDRARRTCIALKGSSAGYGFEPISRSAERALHTLDGSLSINASLRALRELENLLQRVSRAAGTPNPADDRATDSEPADSADRPPR